MPASAQALCEGRALLVLTLIPKCQPKQASGLNEDPAKNCRVGSTANSFRRQMGDAAIAC